MPPPPPAAHARRITYRIHSTDVRAYALSDSLRRALAAITRAGGSNARLAGLPAHEKRWCVLRSPHVNKRSREHFVRRTHRRRITWDAETPRVPAAADLAIAAALPANVATRVDVDAPALLRLRALWRAQDGLRGV